MDHLNYFVPYENLKKEHEIANELRRKNPTIGKEKLEYFIMNKLDPVRRKYLARNGIPKQEYVKFLHK